MDISSQISVVVYFAENRKLLLARTLHHFSCVRSRKIKKIDKSWSGSDAGKLSIL